MTRRKLKKSKRAYWQDLVVRYRSEGNPWPADARAIAEHLLRTNQVSPPKRRRTDEEIIAEELTEALGAQHYTDAQGRRVKRMHAFPITFDDGETKIQKMLWCDITNALPDQMHSAIQVQRRQAGGDVRQIKIAHDSYNDNNPWGARLPDISFNFDKDMAEMDQPTTYGPSLPEEGDA